MTVLLSSVCKRSAVVLLALLLALGSSGCSMLPRKKNAPRTEGEGERQPRQRVIGSVVQTNQAHRFVLINTGTGYVPPAGTELRCMEGEQESAILRTSPEHKRPFIIADIVSGHPEPGHLVVERSAE